MSRYKHLYIHVSNAVQQNSARWRDDSRAERRVWNMLPSVSCLIIMIIVTVMTLDKLRKIYRRQIGYHTILSLCQCPTNGKAYIQSVQWYICRPEVNWEIIRHTRTISREATISVIHPRVWDDKPTSTGGSQVIKTSIRWCQVQYMQFGRQLCTL